MLTEIRQIALQYMVLIRKKQDPKWLLELIANKTFQVTHILITLYSLNLSYNRAYMILMLSYVL